MAKQINWGHQFKRNYRGPLDPDSTFKTYDEMLSSDLLFNGAVVTVTNDPIEAKNGIYLIQGNDSVGQYTFNKGSFGEYLNDTSTIIYNDLTSVLNVEKQETDNTYKITLKKSIFKALDLIGWNISSDLSTGKYAKVEYVIDNHIYLAEDLEIPLIGDAIFRVGNLVDKERQAFYVSYIKNNIALQAVFINNSLDNINTLKSFLVGLDNVGNPLLYSSNAQLKGLFFNQLGKDLSLEIESIDSNLKSGLNDIRTELLTTNRISNSFFLEKMKGWTTVNDAQFFTTIQGKWLWIKNMAKILNGLYSAKRKGAYIDTFDNKVCLSILEGKVLLESKNLRLIVSNVEEQFPKIMLISFMYYVVVQGTLQIKLGDYSITLDLLPSTEWVQFRTTMEWNGQDSLEFSFKNGTENYAEMKIRGIIFLESELEAFKTKYQELLKYLDVLVQIAKDKLNNT